MLYTPTPPLYIYIRYIYPFIGSTYFLVKLVFSVTSGIYVIDSQQVRPVTIFCKKNWRLSGDNFSNLLYKNSGIVIALFI